MESNADADMHIDKFIEICELPRWAYTDSEWKECIFKSDAIINGRFYVIRPPDKLNDFVLSVLQI